MGVSDNLEDRKAELRVMDPEQTANLNKDVKILLGFNKKIIFSTNPAELTAAGKIVILK